MRLHLSTASAAALATLVATTAAAEPDPRVIANAPLRQFLVQFEEGTRRFINGDASLYKSLVSRRPDVMIMGAWGDHERGWEEVSARYDWAGGRFRESGARLVVEYLASSVSGDIAYTVAIERSHVLLVGQDAPRPMALRVTHIFRWEDGGWRLALRHADPLTGKTEAASVLAQASAVAPVEAAAVVTFWRQAGPSLWFAKDAEFDRRFRERFLALNEAAARGALDTWAATAEGAMALVILLDQFPRNAFRGTPRMYDTDALARRIADRALASGHDRAFEPGLRLFLYLPFGHSEDLSDQERSVALARELGEPSLSHAIRHRDIIRRFGRFPHRNPILGRPMTEPEQHYLDNGGFRG